MRGHLVVICLFATTFALSVRSKPHNNHHAWLKSSHKAKDQEVIPEEANAEKILPTFVSLEAGSGDQEVEETSSVNRAYANANANANVNKVDGVSQGNGRGDKSTAVLLSEEELVALLSKETDGDGAEDEEAEEEVGEEAEASYKGSERSEERVEPTDDREDNEEGEKGKGNGGSVEDKTKASNEDEVKEGVEPKAKTLEEEEEAGKNKEVKEKDVSAEENGSAGSEFPTDLDYASDSDLLRPLNAHLPKAESPGTHRHSAEEESDARERLAESNGVKPPPTIAEENKRDTKAPEALEREYVANGGQNQLLGENTDEEKQFYSSGKGGQMEESKPDGELLEAKSAAELEEVDEEADGSKGKNDSAGVTKEKKKKTKSQRARKHAPQRDDLHPGQEQGKLESQESEGQTMDNTVHKAKRRRTGKWAPIVGMNPVQIRATMDLYPSARPSLGGGGEQQEAQPDPCASFRCKRGKSCKVDADGKPACVCQQPSECPPSINEFDHVCGTDNSTYDTSCELFATKCNMEGTKRGHKLHLDYTGPCKFIAPCQESELAQFPLRMRDWLKNVLLQLYDHDSMSPGFLTSKQRVKVKKIHESERRLHAGDHPIELLAQDFEKNYNMYVYPVHWQFAQMDKHPSDRFLSHSELAPLRVPLVPMEHCTSHFFQECDADKDKQVSFREWAQCFGIKAEDTDINLLF